MYYGVVNEEDGTILRLTKDYAEAISYWVTYTSGYQFIVCRGLESIKMYTGLNKKEIKQLYRSGRF